MAERILWMIALAAFLLVYADSIALTRTRSARAATRARIWLAASELLVVAAAVLLHRWGGRAWRIADPPIPAIGLIGAVLALGASALAIAGKLTLGRWFTTNLAIKEGHALITRGPYRWVRHPIYLGVVLLCLATGLVWNGWAYIGMAVGICLLVWSQLRREERLLVEAFGPAYEDYRRRVPALFPLPRPRAARR